MPEVFRIHDPNSAAPELRSSRCAFLLRHWNHIRGERRWPSRGEIDPAAMIPVLPHVMITGIEYNPFRVLYRLVGTEIAHFARFDFTGCYADALHFQDDEAEDWTVYYRAVIGAQAPGIGQTFWTVSGNLKRWMEFVICPLSTDGGIIDRCICVEDYEHTSALELDRLPAVSEQ
jgi:hypothetical protein